MQRNLVLKKVKGWLPGYLFLLPALVFFIIFVLYPMINGIIYSFYEYTNISFKFNGIGNFVHLFKDTAFVRSLINTFIFVLVTVPVVLIFSLFVSMVICGKSERVRSFFRAAFYLPAVSAIVTISIVWQWFYSPQFGLLNYLIGIFGIESKNWLGDMNSALPSLILVLFTLSVGQPIILYIAAIGNIPKTYTEAADIDGAGIWHKFTKITWPLLAPTSLYVIIYTTIGSFQTFAITHLLTGGGPYYGTSTIVFMLFQSAFLHMDYGLASTMGVILAVIIVFVSIIQYKFLSTNVEY
jgi:multiple sugar transport system permease protein